MKMRWFKALLIGWMAAWMAVSGAMAATMPIYMLSNASTPSANVAVSDAMPMPCHKASSAEKSVVPGGCTHCLLCHLALAMSMNFAGLASVSPPAHEFAAEPRSGLLSFVSEPLSPPPRTTDIA